MFNSLNGLNWCLPSWQQVVWVPFSSFWHSDIHSHKLLPESVQPSEKSNGMTTHGCVGNFLMIHSNDHFQCLQFQFQIQICAVWSSGMILNMFEFVFLLVQQILEIAWCNFQLWLEFFLSVALRWELNDPNSRQQTIERTSINKKKN